MTQENEKLISGEDTQPEEPMTPGGNSRIIDDPFVDEFDPGTLETVTNQDFVKHGAAIQESFGSNSAYEVNLQKGKLFFTQHLFTAEGLHLPASFSVVYNQRFADINYVHGQTTIFKGWKLNYQQFINFVGDKCVYVDGAFKEHVFEKSTNNDAVYLDVSTQSGTILRPATDEETFADYVITDGANTDLFFKDNRLVKVTQTKGSTPVETTITYNTSGKVSQVTDGLSKTYTVNYASDGITITDSNNVVLATLTADSNNCLTSVDYYEDTDSGKVCQFTYYPSTYLLSNVRDQFAQEKAIFAYYSDGKFGTMGRYVIKNDDSTEYHSKTITYNSDHTIVSQSNGSMFDEAKIRYKYAFNTDGTLANVCEIDSTGNIIGEQTFVKYDNGVERHLTCKPAEVIHLNNDWPMGIGPGPYITSPVVVCDDTVPITNIHYYIPNTDDNDPNANYARIPTYNNTMDVTFSWHMEYNSPSLPDSDSPLVVELFVNYDLVRTFEYTVDTILSEDKTFTVENIPTTIDTNIVLKVTAPISSATIHFSDLTATYRPYLESKKELFIKHTCASDIARENVLLIKESVGEDNNFWYPVYQPQFIVDGVYVVPDVFTINDYTKTMQSYFLTGKYNFYYNDCRDVMYQMTMVSLNCEDQYVDLVDAPLAILTKSTTPISFDYISIEGTSLRISQRKFHTADECSYTKLDSYLRPVEEFLVGSPIQTHQYDRFGNETELYSGGTAGMRYTSAYSTDGQKFIKNVDYIHTDTHTTNYAYNADGLVSQITTPINQSINFDYQNKYSLNRVSAVVNGQTNANDITYDGPLITSLSHNGTSFQFVYDDRNNISEVKVAGATLLSKTVSHSTNGSCFTQSTYANGQIICKFYDKYDRLIKLSEGINGPVLAKFIYSDETVSDTVTEPTDQSLSISGSSKLRVVIDATANTRTTYHYDNLGALTKVENANITITQLEKQADDDWDKKVEYSMGDDKILAVYKYVSDTDNSLQTEETQLNELDKISTSYAKDSLERLTSTTVMCGNYGYKNAISYSPRQEKTWVPNSGQIILSNPSDAVPLVAPILPIDGYWRTDTVGTTPYISAFNEYSMVGETATLVRSDIVTYDANGNITKYGNVTYVYDGLNRLVRENNPSIDKTTTWCYDVGGNITSRTEYAYTTGTLGTPTNTFNYAYSTGWKDQLTSFNGQSIIYDQVGNPTSYRGATLTWTRGRLLASYKPSGSSYTTTMQYDANGIRYSKVVPAYNHATTTTYFYDGNKLVKEKILVAGMGGNPSTTHKTYLYNSQGVVGFAINNTLYSYRKNLFGDIIAIYQDATKVAEYIYDAFGHCTITLDTNGIGAANPFRYRGYYWDNDLQLYYLMSRYYDPQVGRFINADTLDYLEPDTINGLNLYAYCYNNPVMYADPSGHFVLWAIVIAAAIIGGVIGGVKGHSQGKTGWSLAGSIFKGVVLGAMIAGMVIMVSGIGVGIATAWAGSILGIKAGVAAAIGMLVVDTTILLSNAFLNSNFELFEWGGSYTPDTPNNNTPLPNFDK